MALLSKRERELIHITMSGPNTDSQRRSLLRELQRDDDSMIEEAIDTKLGLARKR